MRMDAIEENACTNTEIRDEIYNRLNAFQFKFENQSEHELKHRLSMQTKLEGR